MSVTTYDDRDPIIQYSGAWVRAGNPADLDATSTFTNSGSGASATITFKGTQIRVFGSIKIATPKTTSSYSIDGGSPTLFTPSFDIGAAGNSAGGFFFRQNFFTSGTLSPDTQHTLVIGDFVNVETGFVIDYIEVVGSANTTTSPSPSTSSSNASSRTTSSEGTTSTEGTTTSSLPTTSVTGTSSLTSSRTSSPIVPTSNSNPSTTFTNSPVTNPTSAGSAITAETSVPVVVTNASSSKASTGTIVGATIAGLALILLGVLGYFVYKRMGRRKLEELAAAPPKLEVDARPFYYQDAPSRTRMSALGGNSTTVLYPAGKSLSGPTTSDEPYRDVAAASPAGPRGDSRYYSRYTQPPPPEYYEG
ncbi:hypothetical protein BDN70DRAFT_872305 [Pholiota conissans]|uniref:Uncharacterized protein n=1 Tax=Pholiota conissans TaxID=109636 RepID=A0A9P5ZAN0_9AGAR|nr:hypothetical protein BDN70DRAFT_872305 [Pholiota conissans]